MNLKSLNDAGLVSNALTLAREEREKLTIFLHHLKEIDRRRLFSAYGYKSLFEMTVKHFLYSEDEAYRRLSAMKLLKDIPEVAQKINQGALSLTHLSLAQKHFRHEKKLGTAEISLDKKLLFIEQISHTSVRKAERISFSFCSNPELARPDRVRVISESTLEMKFSLSVKAHEKVDQLKGVLAHKYPNLSLGELFELLCDLGLKEFAPEKESVASKKTRVKKSKAQIRRDVFKKADNKCESCGSGFALEIDHIHAKAFGGEDSLENLRLLCRSCNQRAAIQIFGIEKMDQYLY